MPYPCKNGTSIILRIGACECAMIGIQSGASLCQPNTSTVDSMPWFIKIYKWINEMAYVIFCNICLHWWEWPHIWKTWSSEYRRGQIVANLVLLQEFIEHQLASDVVTWVPPNGRPEVTLHKCNCLKFRHIVNIFSSSPCVDVLFASHWVLPHTQLTA